MSRQSVWVLGLMLTAATPLAAGAATVREAIQRVVNPAAHEGLGVPGEPGGTAPDIKSAVSDGSQPTVEVKSFIFIGSRSNLAELCGQVTQGGAEFSLVRILVDPDSKNSGIYNAVAGADGAFCAVLVTYTGNAAVSVQSGGHLSAQQAVAAGGAGRAQ